MYPLKQKGIVEKFDIANSKRKEPGTQDIESKST